MTERSKTQFPRLLPDAPVNEDSFLAGAHDALAETLAKLLRQPAVICRAIGLEGVWGSGKSSVVEMAERKMRADEQPPRFFTFDLWAHEGDDFRTAFLQKFLAWGLREGMLNKERGQKVLEDLSVRKTVTTEVEKPRFSLVGAWIAFLTPILPLAYLWLGPIVSANNVSERLWFLGNDFSASKWIVSFFLALLCSIYVVLIGKLASHLWKQRSISKAFAETFSILTQQSEATEKHITREDQPTAIEFERILSDILGYLKKHQKIVVVLDNADRLDRDNAGQALSEMRYLISRASGEGTALSALRFIVPYDPQHLFERRQYFSPNANSDILALAEPPISLDHATGMIEKTFATRLRVPPALLSNWRQFLRDKFDQAFGEKAFTAVSLNRVERAFEFKNIPTNSAPSARNIIRYINQLVVLNLRWGDEIPIESCALYILEEVKLGSYLERPGRERELTHQYKNLFDGINWSEDVAAIHYNVPKNKVGETWLLRLLRKAIADRDAEAFKGLCETPGFDAVIDLHVQEMARQWASDDLQTLGSVSNLISSGPLTEFHRGSLCKVLAAEATHMGDPRGTSIDTIREIANLSVHLPAAAAKKLLTGMAERLDWYDEKKTPRHSLRPRQWLEALETFAIAWADCPRLDDKAPSGIIAPAKIPGEEEYAFSVLKNAHEFKTFDAPNSGLSAHKSSFVDSIKELISEDEAAPDLPEMVVSFSRFENVGSELTAIADAAVRQLSQAAAQSGGNAQILLEAIFATNSDLESSEFRTALTNGVFAYWLQHAHDNENMPMFGMVAFLLKKLLGDAPITMPQNDQVPHLGAAPQAAKIYQDWRTGDENLQAWHSRFIQLTEQYEQVSQVVNDLVKGNCYANEVINDLLDRQKFENLDVVEFLKGYRRIVSALSEDEAFFGTTRQWGHWIPKKLSSDQLYNLDEDLISKVFAPDENKLPELRDFATQTLQATTHEEWKSSLANRSGPTVLLGVANAAGGNIKIKSEALLQPLCEHFAAICAGDFVGESFPNNWGELPTALDPAIRKTLFTNLAKLSNRDIPSDDGVLQFLFLFDRWHADIIDAFDPDRLVKNIFTPALRRADLSQESEPLANFFGAVTSGPLKSAGTDARAEFEAVLGEKYAEDGAPPHPLIEGIGKEIGYEPPRKPSENDGDERDQ